MAYYHCLLFDLDGTLLDFGAAEEMMGRGCRKTAS